MKKKKHKTRKYKKLKTYNPDAVKLLEEIENEEKVIENRKNNSLSSFSVISSESDDDGVTPSSSENIELINTPILFYKVCPLCQSKIKRSKVLKIGNQLNQQFKCKKKDCPFEKIITLNL